MNRDIRICYIGDSMVNGTGDTACLGWTGRLSQRLRQSGLNVTHYNLGIRRETTGGLRQRVAAELPLRFQGDFEKRLVISTGINDTTFEDGVPRIAPEASVENMTAILTWAKKLYPTLVVGPATVPDPDQDHRVAALSQAFAEAADRLGVLCLPLHEFTKKRHPLVCPGR